MPLQYVLVTPAHNEAAFIEATIQSVLAQTLPPQRWVIVSDGSTDDTDEVVASYASRTPWLSHIRLPPRADRNFAAKVHAFNAGYEAVRSSDYDVIGNVDADISFGPDYLAYLLGEMEKDPAVGVAGTDYIEGDFHSFKDSFINAHHVNGQCQLFRRGCFERIGGYRPIRGGGIDWVAVTSARMHGWKTRSFHERTFTHHRRMGTAGGGVLGARYHYGKKDYFLGGHPAWEIFRAAFQMTKPPYLIGGLCLFAGYFWSWLRGMEVAVPEDLMRFHRQEQMQRLRELIADRLRVGRRG